MPTTWGIQVIPTRHSVVMTQKVTSEHKIFVQCWTNVENVGPTLYKCYTDVLCLLGRRMDRDVNHFDDFSKWFIVLKKVLSPVLFIFRPLMNKTPFGKTAVTANRPLGYERVYLPLYKMADTSFHIQGDEMFDRSLPVKIHSKIVSS